MRTYSYVWTSFIIKAKTHYIIWTDILGQENVAKTFEELEKQLSSF